MEGLFLARRGCSWQAATRTAAWRAVAVRSTAGCREMYIYAGNGRATTRQGGGDDCAEVFLTEQATQAGGVWVSDLELLRT